MEKSDEYRTPNQENVETGDFLIVVDDGSYKKVQITKETISGLSIIVSYKDEKGDEVTENYPYSTAIIQKTNGTILVGERININSEIKGLLRILYQENKKWQ
jgi:hypothetical protein